MFVHLRHSTSIKDIFKQFEVIYLIKIRIFSDLSILSHLDIPMALTFIELKGGTQSEFTGLKYLSEVN